MKKIVGMALIVMMLVLCGCKSEDYKKAQSLLEYNRYDEAQTIFEELGDYQDSRDLVKECKYRKAENLYEKDFNYSDAQAIYKELGDYKDSRIKNCEMMMVPLQWFSPLTASYEDVIHAKETIACFESLSPEEQSKVSDKSLLPTDDMIAEAENELTLKYIETMVIIEAEAKIKKSLINSSSYQDNPNKKNHAMAYWDEKDPTIVHGTVDMYYSATNSMGGRIDSNAYGHFDGTYINGVFKLLSIDFY